MIRMSDTEFDRAVEAALAEIPDEFRVHLENVMVEVRPRPDRALMREYEVPDDILGLYVGTPLGERLAEGLGPMLPDRVLIFRDNLCEMCESREELIDEIRITVLHEIGHHFGMDEDQLDELGYG
ncbi:MAG: metallopeptidase family protein [Phycisphaerales bacterium]|nr:metallopeptidase family protein [Phycisphaerales bacterium]